MAKNQKPAVLIAGSGWGETLVGIAAMNIIGIIRKIFNFFIFGFFQPLFSGSSAYKTGNMKASQQQGEPVSSSRLSRFYALGFTSQRQGRRKPCL